MNCGYIYAYIPLIWRSGHLKPTWGENLPVHIFMYYPFILFWVNKRWDNSLLCADILQHWLSALTIQIFVSTSVFNTAMVFNHKDWIQPGNPMTNSTKDFTVNKTMNETSFWHTEQLSAVFCRLCFFFLPQVEKQLQKQGAVILAKEN